MKTISILPEPIGDQVLAIDTWSPKNASPNDKFQYIDIASVDRESKTLTETTVISAADAPSRARQIVRGGDVLVSTVRPNLNAVAMVSDDLSDAIASTGFCVLRCNPKKLDKKFLFHWVRTTTFVNDMVRKATGASYPAVSDRIVKESMIPLPPLSEQKRIADILDKADAIRRKRQEAVAESNLLTIATYIDWFGHPTNAADVYLLRECVSILSGGTPSKKNPAFWNGDFPWVSPKDMKVEMISDAEDHVTERAFSETTLKRIPADSILIVVRGMILAHTVPIALTSAPVAINQDIKALIANDDFEPEFLCWTMRAAHNYILSKVATAAHGTKRLEVEHLSAMPVPNVPRERQVAFTNAARRIREISNRPLAAETDNLFNSLVQRAFKGEL